MIGEEWPQPGMAVFHATFSVWLQHNGTPVSSLAPSPRGPRQHGQSLASVIIAAANVTTNVMSPFCMAFSLTLRPAK
jgi:hypothetical protein